MRRLVAARVPQQQQQGQPFCRKGFLAEGRLPGRIGRVATVSGSIAMPPVVAGVASALAADSLTPATSQGGAPSPSANGKISRQKPGRRLWAGPGTALCDSSSGPGRHQCIASQSGRAVAPDSQRAECGLRHQCSTRHTSEKRALPRSLACRTICVSSAKKSSHTPHHTTPHHDHTRPRLRSGFWR